MKNAILLHGRPSKKEFFDPEKPSESNCHWFPWLQKQLLINGVHAQTPEILEPYAPKYENWQREIERFELAPETILVGHSCGGGALVRWLSENPQIKVGKVVLVAPWIDVEKDDWPLFDFEIDSDIADRTAGLTIFHSTSDAPEIQSSIKVLQAKLNNYKYVEFENAGHFTRKSMKTDEFPELLKECLR
ncbi:MAG TPA: alpha/beta hydrolase [Candidatus Saccharimonadales bacterium]